MHSLWSGSITFGLITFPVHMYSASKERVFDFSMLRKNDLCPISFKRVCRSSGEEVPYSEIVKGYEYREGDYVILEPDDFKHVIPKESDAIDIKVFVAETDVDTKYLKKPYYLEPGKGAGKAYVLLREALEKSGKVGIAEMVFREREDLVMVKAEGKYLVLIQMRYEDEIREAEGLQIPKTDITEKEMDMAVKLVGSLSGKFRPSEFVDNYSVELGKIIREKARGHKLKPLPKAPKPTKSEDLVAQLEASLARHRSARAER